jgi:hypothetical protein
MLAEWIVKEKEVKYLTIILREVNWEDDKKTDDRIVYRKVLRNAKLQIGKMLKK